VFILLGNISLLAQEVVNGEDGNKIIFYPDGTWQPYGKDGERKTYQPDSTQYQKNLSEFLETQRKERELSLELIKKRIELTTFESELALLNTKAATAEQVVFDMRQKIRLAQERIDNLETSLVRAKEWTKVMEGSLYLAEEPRERRLEEWRSQTTVEYNQSKNNGFYLYTAKDDLMLNPPESPCNFIFSGTDIATGKKRQDMRPEVLFSYTDPGLESHFKKQDLIEGRVNLTSLSAGFQVLNLEISVASKQAPTLFGLVKKNDFITFKTIDGHDFKLINSSMSAGKWDERRQAYVYRLQYRIGSKENKWLSKLELDTIEVRWSNVKESYQILDVDVLSRQFACLINN